MRDKNRELSVYRLGLAKETLANAKLCIDNCFYRDAVNRSYYAAFYAAQSSTPFSEKSPWIWQTVRIPPGTE